jgi:hypothetical protein
MDLDEKQVLETYVEELDAWEEYDWAIHFISSDYISAFERSREFLSKVFSDLSGADKLNYLMDTWESNHMKGYVTEMETTAMINLAKDWQIDNEFLSSINQL